MQKIDWKRKLTSRKLWLSIASFVSMLLIYFGHAESEAEQVAALIMAGASIVGYIIGEGLADNGNGVVEIADPVDEIADPVDEIADKSEG